MESKPHTRRSRHTIWEPGNEVVLAVLEGRLAGQYRAAVVGSNQQALYLCISLPDEQATLPEGSKVRVSFISEDGKAAAFDSHTTSAGSDAYLSVAWPSETGWRQRRQHLRQGLVLPVVIRQPRPTHASDDATSVRLPGVICDLSQGGASLHCRGLKAREDDLLTLSLRLPGSEEPLEVHCQVRWGQARESLIGVQFLGVCPELSAELRRLIEVRQRRLARTVDARLRGIAPEDIWPRRV